MDLQDIPATHLESTRELKKYTGTAARILNLLISGVTQEQAAAAVAVTAGFVSQLCAEEDFQIQVVQGMKGEMEKSLTIDKTLVDIEFDLVKKLKDLVPWVTTVDQVSKLFRVVNEAKRKTQQYIPNVGLNGGSADGTSAATVQIIVPQFIQNNFVVTPNREIVGINDKPLVTLNSKQLNNMVQQAKQQLPKPVVDEMVIPNVEYHTNKQKQRGKDPWGDL